MRYIIAATLMITLSSCASWSDRTNKAVTCAALGAIVGGAIAGAVDDDNDEGTIASGAAAGGIIGGVLCGVEDTEEPQPRPVVAQRQPEKAMPTGDIDSDGDGVTDDFDLCPNTSPEYEVDENGCPILKDSDGDGITDGNDLCPNTPAGTEVDINGCAIVGSTIGTLQNIHFAFNEAKLVPSARLVLDEVVSAMKGTPGMRIAVEGHTDNVGSDAYNLSLSRRRAVSASRYLQSQGIGGDRLTIVARGESAPVASNDTESGRSSNRRVEFIVR